MTGNGLQVALFNSTSGAANPDYAFVHLQSIGATLLSLLCLAAVAAAIPIVHRHWPSYREFFLERRSFLVLAAALLCTGLAIVLTQRPRPSYLFSVTVCFMAVIGLSLAALTHRRSREVTAACFVIAFLVVLIWPSYYVDRPDARPLYSNYLRLQPFAHILMGADKTVLIGDYAGELANYLRLAPSGTRFYDYSLLSSWDKREPLCDFLRRKGISFAFLQPRIVAQLPGGSGEHDSGENRVGSGCARLNSESDSDWRLLRVEGAR